MLDNIDLPKRKCNYQCFLPPPHNTEVSPPSPSPHT